MGKWSRSPQVHPQGRRGRKGHERDDPGGDAREHQERCRGLHAFRAAPRNLGAIPRIRAFGGVVKQEGANKENLFQPTPYPGAFRPIRRTQPAFEVYEDNPGELIGSNYDN